jgi:signal transduction histidine kinase
MQEQNNFEVDLDVFLIEETVFTDEYRERVLFFIENINESTSKKNHIKLLCKLIDLETRKENMSSVNVDNYILKGNSIINENNDLESKLTFNTSLASYYFNIGHKSKAVSIILSLIELIEDPNFPLALEYAKGIIYLNATVFLQTKRNTHLMIQYLEKGIELGKRLHLRKVENQAYYLISDFYNRIGEYEKSIENFNKSVAYNIEVANHFRLATLYNKKGNWMAELAKYNEAIECYDLAILTCKDLNVGIEKVSTFSKIKCYIMLQEIEKACELMSAIPEDTIDFNSHDVRVLYLEVSYLISKNTKDFEGAMKYLEDYHDILDIDNQVTVEIEVDNAIKLNEFKTQKRELELVKEKNEEILKYTTKLEDANEELIQFSHMLTHDIREPLRTAKSFLSVIERKHSAELPEKSRGYIQMLHNNLDHIHDLSKDLLELSKIGGAEFHTEEIDLEMLIDEVMANLTTLIRENNAKILFDDLPVIKAPRLYIYLLFQNLISNAIKYNTNVPLIKIVFESDENHFVFKVIDNGIGISDDNKIKIFLAFNRTPQTKEYQGTGIGLAIVSKIIEKLQGKIWVESTLGEGSTFCFKIPK